MNEFFVALQYEGAPVHLVYTRTATEALNDFLNGSEALTDLEYVEDGDQYKVVVSDEYSAQVFTISYTPAWKVVD